METQARLDTLSAAVDQLNDSDKFRRVLETILAIGNYMNGGTPRGGAYGFKVDTLTKLHTIKSIDQKINLMHFVAHHLDENDPSLLAFAGELPHVVDARRIPFTQLKADMNILNTEFNMLQGQVRASATPEIDGDQFNEVMAPFVEEASEVMEELSRDMSNLDASVSETLTSYGEDPRKTTTEDFFCTIYNFIEEFKVAYFMHMN